MRGREEKVYKVSDVISVIENIAPLSFACEWDNVGLLIGNRETTVKNVLLTLDVDEFVVDEAIQKGCNLILSHHPLIFHPVKRLNEENISEKVIMKLIKNDISLYSAHTNLDVAPGGLNDYMASKLELNNTKILEISGVSDKGEYGFGRYAVLDAPLTMNKIIEKCKSVFNLNVSKFVGNPDDLIRTVAVNCGGGAGSIDSCFNKNIDLFISGDFKYNILRDAYENKLNVIDVGHYNSEHIVIDLFYEILSKNLTDINLTKSEKNIDFIKYL